jgi:hypothetical protein
MAEHITLAEARAWLEPTKLTLSTLDSELEAQVATQVFAQLLGTFDTTTWVNAGSTPKAIRTMISMYYVAWTYDKHYSDDAENNAYADKLRRYADIMLAQLIAGTLELEELPDANIGVSSPSFFPNDESSAREPSDLSPSDGPPSFTMGTRF